VSDTLPLSDRALDRAVAEAVMGWYVHPGGVTRDGGLVPDDYRSRDGKSKCVALSDGSPNWHPSTDIAAAYEMEAAVHDPRAYVKCLVDLVTGGQRCECTRGPGVCGYCWYNVAHASPEQRCRAALLAVATSVKEEALAEAEKTRARGGRRK
jgi:hypothetical protein